MFYISATNPKEEATPTGFSLVYESKSGNMSAVYYDTETNPEKVAADADSYVKRGVAVRAVVAPGRTLFDMVCHDSWASNRREYAYEERINKAEAALNTIITGA